MTRKTEQRPRHNKSTGRFGKDVATERRTSYAPHEVL